MGSAPALGLFPWRGHDGAGLGGVEKGAGEIRIQVRTPVRGGPYDALRLCQLRATSHFQWVPEQTAGSPSILGSPMWCPHPLAC